MQWQAKYKDGFILKQFDETREPREVSSEVIDRKKVESFTLFLESGDQLIPLLTQHLDEGQRLIYRRRTFLIQGGKTEVVHLMGWQQTVKGENVQSIAYVFESGAIHLAGKFRENHPVFDKVIFTDSEKAQGLV